MRCGFVVRVPRDLLDEAKKATEKAAKAAMRKAPVQEDDEWDDARDLQRLNQKKQVA